MLGRWFMLSPLLVLSVYCLLIGGASLAGGMLVDRVRLTHRRMQHLVSFVGGLMLSVAVLHMIPHAAAAAGSFDSVVHWTLAGVLLMFFLLRACHFHHYGPADAEAFDEGAAGEEPTAEASGESRPAVAHAHHGACDHPHHVHDHRPGGGVGWTGVFLGLSVHTLLDGAALAAAVQADWEHETAAPLWGFGIFAAVLLHKPLDAVSISALMASSGWPPSLRRAVNAAFAVMAPAGALALMMGIGFVENPGPLVGRMLAFAAGAFLCIALADLLPELELHSHDRLSLSGLLLAGVLAGWCIGLLEPDHLHGPAGENAPGAASGAGDPVDDHDHSHDH